MNSISAITIADIRRARALQKPHIAQVRQIADTVAAYAGVHVLMILGHSRKAEVVRARDLVCWIAYKRLRLTYAAIGEALSGRDHTTVMAAVRREEERRGRSM